MIPSEWRPPSRGVPGRSSRTALAAAAIASLAILIVVVGCGGGDRSSDRGSDDQATVGGSEVSFVVDGTTTYGTLEIPADPSGRRLPAALLIPGSGPTDRDGNDPPALTAETLALVANLLAEEGIASLRYDKYFSGRTGAGSYADDPGSFTVGAELRQAEAAYRFLGRRPQVDRSRMLIVGHSEGGMVALDLADSVADAPVGLALLEPQDLRHLDIVRIQADEAIGAAVASGSSSPAEGRADAARVARAIAEFRQGRPVSTAGMSPLVLDRIRTGLLTPANAAFDRSHDRIVPAALAARVRAGTRVLVTDGTRDTNIPPSTIGPLVRALAGAGAVGPGLRILKGTDHLMHLPDQPDSEAVLAPEVVAAIRDWARPYAAG